MEEKVEENYLQIIAGFKYEQRLFAKDRGQEEAKRYLTLLSKIGKIDAVSRQFISKKNLLFEALDEAIGAEVGKALHSQAGLNNTKSLTGPLERPSQTSLEEGILSTSSDIISHPVFGSLYQVQLVLTGTKEYLKSCSAATVEEGDVSYHKISRVNRATLDVTIGFDNEDDTSERLIADYVATFFNKDNHCNNSIRGPYYECDELDAGRIDATADGPIRAILKLQERLTSYVKPRHDSYFVNNSVVYYWQNVEGAEKTPEKERTSDEESPRLHERYEAE